MTANPTRSAAFDLLAAVLDRRRALDEALDALPPLELRTMTGDLPDASVLPDDVPNLKQQSLAFYWRLFRAWAAMGFRSPTIAVNGEIHA